VKQRHDRRRFGDVIGLPDFIPAAADIVLVALNTALINARR